MTGITLPPALGPRISLKIKPPADDPPEIKDEEKQKKPAGPKVKPFYSMRSGPAITTMSGFQYTSGDARYLFGSVHNNNDPESGAQLEGQGRYSSGVGTFYARGSYEFSDANGPDLLTTENACESPSKIFGFHLFNVFTDISHDSPDSAGAEFRMAPVLKTPAFNLPGVTGLRLGFSPQLRYNSATQENSLVLRSKIEWSHKTDRWSGASVEVYASADDGDLSPLGMYFWSGGYASNPFGEGNLLIEGGAWVGAEAFDGTKPFGQAIATGLMFKTTFSGSTSGFEPGRYSGM